MHKKLAGIYGCFITIHITSGGDGHGQMLARQADVSDANSHVSVKAKLSMCLHSIRSERAADL